MRRAILVLLTATALAGFGVLPAEAVGTRYPFCITGPDQPGLSNCTFTSYEQCRHGVRAFFGVRRQSLFCQHE